MTKGPRFLSGLKLVMATNRPLSVSLILLMLPQDIGRPEASAAAITSL